MKGIARHFFPACGGWPPLSTRSQHVSYLFDLSNWVPQLFAGFAKGAGSRREKGTASVLVPANRTFPQRSKMERGPTVLVPRIADFPLFARDARILPQGE